LRVEKINNQKARIILTIDELAKHKITLKDIKEGKDKARDFFFEILEDSNLIEDFADNSTQLLIEAASKDNLFMITITKADCIPDIKQYPNQKDSFTYTVSSNIYSFDTLKNLYEFCIKTKQENLFVGTNSLYSMNDKYFLIFSDKTIKKSEFVKTFSVLSEYSSNYYARPLYKTALKEHSNLLLDKNAICSICNI